MTKKEKAIIDSKIRVRLRWISLEEATYESERANIAPVKVKTLRRWGLQSFKEQYPELYENELRYYYHKPCIICGHASDNAVFEYKQGFEKICSDACWEKRWGKHN